MQRRKLLMISPVLPSAATGLNLRALQFQRAFARKFSVTLLEIDLGYGSRSSDAHPSPGPDKVIRLRLNDYQDARSLYRRLVYRLSPADYFRRFAVPSEWRFISERSVARVAEIIRRERYDLIHVFRLYLAPFVLPCLDASERAFIQLDLDDIESIARARIAELYLANGDLPMAARMIADAQQYRHIEQKVASRFDRLFVCSEPDSEKLAELYDCHAEVVPNTMAPVSSTPPPRALPFTFLLVGSLGYYPNQEGLEYFCREVLPLLRASAPLPFRVWVIGDSLPAAQAKRLRHHREVELLGRVDNLQFYYENAHAVIVPLRAGGGTRFKILEAFSYRRPVITTSIGIEGICAMQEQEVLIADSAAEFARGTLRLMNDEALCKRLAENGLRLLIAHYTPELAERKLLDLAGSVFGQQS